MRRYYIDHKKACEDSSRKWRVNNREKVLLRAAKNRAKRDNLSFNLTVEDIVIPERCPILGIELKFSVGKQTDNSPTLDKVIPEKGYIKGNVWIISNRANRIKNDATLKELELLVFALKNVVS